MKKVFNRLLKKYRESDWLLQSKARTLLILNVAMVFFLIIDGVVTSMALGRPAPEILSNGCIIVVMVIMIYFLVRGKYNVAAAISIIAAIAGITWTRYASTGQFSSDPAYDFMQYLVEMILVMFYAILIAHRKHAIIATAVLTLLLLGVYMVSLDSVYTFKATPATISVFVSGFFFLAFSAMTGIYTFIQNRRAIDVAIAETHMRYEQERKYREIFNSTNEAIFIHDADTGQLLDVNEPMLKMYGFRYKEEALGATVGLLSGSQTEYSSGKASEWLKRAVESPQTFTWLARQTSGRTFWVEVSLHYSEIAGQKRILAVVRDIDERMTAEAALHKSEEMHRKLIAAIPDVIVRTDMEGTIVYINDTGVPDSGIVNFDNILGKNIFELITDADRDRARRHAAGLLMGEVGVQEYSVVGEGGRMIECEINGDILRQNNGTPFGMVFVVRDLTEKKKLQAQLLQAQKMEAIGRLAGGVAHDYNNMIGVVLGYASLLEQELSPGDPAIRKVRSIIAAAERTANLTRQLLAFSRQQVIVPVVLNVNDELTALKKMFGRFIGENIRFLVQLRQDLWPIRFDPTQLAQILSNLMTNARDAISDTGTIIIATDNEKLTASRASIQDEIPPGDYVVISCTDSGCGIPASILSSIFEPFYTTKPKEKGTGLGLATVFGIVQQNDGFIRVASEEGKGTRFDIFLPRYRGGMEPVGAEDVVPAVRGHETVLVVEDEEDLLSIIRTALEANGYTVLGAQDPQRALEVMTSNSNRITLLITDVVMPDMNGRELQQRLTALQPALRTLFISGYPADIVAPYGVLEAGIHFLQKPFTPAVLLKKLREVVSHV